MLLGRFCGAPRDSCSAVILLHSNLIKDVHGGTYNSGDFHFLLTIDRKPNSRSIMSFESVASAGFTKLVDDTVNFAMQIYGGVVDNRWANCSCGDLAGLNDVHFAALRMHLNLQL